MNPQLWGPLMCGPLPLAAGLSEGRARAHCEVAGASQARSRGSEGARKNPRSAAEPGPSGHTLVTSMEGLGRVSPSFLLDPGGECAAAARRRGPGTETNFCLGSGGAAPGSGDEAGAPRPHPCCANTARPRRRRCPDSPRESHSLTDVAARPPDRARRPRPRGRRLEDVWGEPGPKPQPGGSAHSPAWRWQPGLQFRGPRHCPPTQVDSPPPHPEGAYSPLNGTFGVERAQSGDQWAVPLCGGPAHWSLSSAVSEKSSVRSHEFRAQSACVSAHKREGSDPVESLASQPCQPSVPNKTLQSLHTQLLKNKLEEAIMSSRDQKIVALVLTRLKKAQRMRELQQQAAAAWEELKRSDQKVQMTLERERKLLLQESQEQWRQERRVRRRDGPAGTVSRSERECGARPEEEREGARAEAQPAPAPAPAPATRRQSGELRLQEPERTAQPLERRERAAPRKSLNTLETQKKAQETNLSSVVNYQARKVLLDCQAKAEELLRKLSLEQSSQRCREAQRGLAKESAREPRPQEEPPQQVRRRAEAEEPARAHRRLLAELAERRARRAGSGGDRAQRARELSVLREKNQRVLKLKAEREEKCHIEGIKEAIRRKEQRVEQISRERDNAFQEFQKLSRASQRDQARALAGSFLDLRAREESQPRAGPQGCGGRVRGPADAGLAVPGNPVITER